MVSPDVNTLIRGIYYQGHGWGETYRQQGIARTYLAPSGPRRMEPSRRRVVAAFTAPVDASSLGGFGEIVRLEAEEVELRVAQDQLAALIARLGTQPLADVTVEPASLEDGFLEQYR